MELKLCRGCQKKLPVETHFYKHGIQPNTGRQQYKSKCKDCYNKINRPKVREYARKNKEIYYRNHARWVERNREKYDMIKRLASQRRLALKETLPASLTEQEWIACLEYFEHECAYCGADSALEQDHVIPLSAGGGYTQDNIIPACKSCNSSKLNQDMETWYRSRSYFTEGRLIKIKKYLEITS